MEQVPTWASDDGRVELYLGDCRSVMAGMEPESVDAIVTDPPYGLEFMGKEWDKLLVKDRDAAYPSCRHAHGPNAYVGGVAAYEWYYTWAVAALRVLKPGAHLVAFGGTRTHHRLWCALEDAGFEIRDTLMWLFGSGFPKSLDVSKAIDRAAGAERQVVGSNPNHRPVSGVQYEGIYSGGNTGAASVTAPATDAARQWDGWGTALKPAWEPILLARKPLSEPTVAANVQRWGIGALNVDGCRIEIEGGSPAAQRRQGKSSGRPGEYGDGHAIVSRITPERYATPRAGEGIGRWPANVVLDEDAAAMLDVQSGKTSTTGQRSARSQQARVQATTWGTDNHESMEYPGDSGGASRFFYCAKADSAERRGTKHPTVKPLELMKWLVTLVTPPDGMVLDPLCGSGTTLEAAYHLGFRAIGIDTEAEYLEDAKRRLAQGMLL